MVESDRSPPHDEFLFLQIVSMYQLAAMQQLGKIMNPVTNAVEKDLDQAKFSIDTVEVLKRKTSGNLSKAEEEFLNKVLFELQMNYVEELEATKKEAEKAKGGGENAEDDGRAEEEPLNDEKD
ncbi:MAG: DUF1844 domain-containing protein [Candidatus Krumholzibacteriia bacterium]